MHLDPLTTLVLAGLLIGIATYLTRRNRPDGQQSRMVPSRMVPSRTSEVGDSVVRFGEVITLYGSDQTVNEVAPLGLFTQPAEESPSVPLLVAPVATFVAPPPMVLPPPRTVVTSPNSFDLDAILDAIPRRMVPGGGGALFAPPPDLRVALEYMLRHHPEGRYLWPVGWLLDRATGKPVLVWTSLKGEANHFLVSGMTNSGKDSLVRYGFFALCAQHSAQELQFAIIDGKGLDWLGFSGKAHTWGISLAAEYHGVLLARITREMKRRQRLMQDGIDDTATGKRKTFMNWDEYVSHSLYRGDMPMLVVLVSELAAIQIALEESDKKVGREALKRWLTFMTTTGRAFGIRMVVLNQTVSNMPTDWRGQLNTFLAGAQPAPNHDAPNTGMQTDIIIKRGGIPPSEMPAVPTYAGVLTYVQGSAVGTVRCGFIDDTQMRQLLDAMPDAPTELNTAKLPSLEEPVEKTLVAKQSPTGQRAMQLDEDGWDGRVRSAETAPGDRPPSSYFTEELPVLLATTRTRPTQPSPAPAAPQTAATANVREHIVSMLAMLQAIQGVPVAVSPRTIAQLVFENPSAVDIAYVEEVMQHHHVAPTEQGASALAILAMQHRRKLDAEYSSGGLKPSRRSLFRLLYNTESAPGGRRWSDLKRICDQHNIYVEETPKPIEQEGAHAPNQDALTGERAVGGLSMPFARDEEQDDDNVPLDDNVEDEAEGADSQDVTDTADLAYESLEHDDEQPKHDTEYWFNYQPPTGNDL